MTFSSVLAGTLAAAWTTAFGFSAVSFARQDMPAAAEFRPVPPPIQPVAYSHKTHVEQGLECMDCHTTATTADRAMLPTTAICVECHSTRSARSTDIERLTSYHARGEAVPWVRVYRLPAYVFFSHKVHMSGTGSLTCDSCHGNVGGMHVTQKVKDTSMAACMDCHRTASAPNRCDSCHDPL